MVEKVMMRQYHPNNCLPVTKEESKMKRNSIMVLVAISVLIVSACGRADSYGKNGQVAMAQSHESMAGSDHGMNMQEGNKMEKVGEKAHAMVQLPTIQCEMCKNSIEQGLAKIKGIESVHIDLEGKMGHINYDGTLLKLIDIEQAIAELGYQANDVPADPVAYEALPECCKVPQ
ncbi:MAG: heavy-metal-associated domain-containing protein [Chloroflexota bacterium]|nr:MAG: heavy-metal-associated domain-containing protein [Chloroflexota bacterium]